MTTLDDKISRKAEQIAQLDERIGRLMSKRVDLENELAALYEARRAGNWPRFMRLAGLSVSRK